MKVLLSWLNDYIETALSAEQIAEILSDLGLPNEGIEKSGNDAVIDVEVTSNRGDCLGLIGIARELAAVTGKPLKMPEVKLTESDKDVAELCSVEIAEPDLCGRYTGRVIEGIKVGPSPDWLKGRIEAVGMRSVNNVVDATNYAMLETGQPPHAFDYDKITDGRIIVRKAKAGEQIVSIDGGRCKFEPDMLIIADPDRPVAIAGVMGGLETEVSDSTTSILLEDAYFDPVSVRMTSRALALPSEAAFRFERTVDIEAVDWASARTAQLIAQVAGGKIARGVVDTYPRKPQSKQVTLRLARLNALLGIEVATDEAVRILAALKFEPQKKDSQIICTVPSWRRTDVCREADLIEEVTRVYGYDKIPTEKKIEIEVIPVDCRQRICELVGGVLNSAGYYEAINVSFIDDSMAELFTGSAVAEHMAVQDASKKSANLLRQTLIGSLLAVLKTNYNAGNTQCRVFEISDTFVPAGKGDKLPVEKTKLTLVSDGGLQQQRGAVEGVIRAINKEAQIVFEPAELTWAQAGALIKVNGRDLGIAGVVSDLVKDKFDFKNVTPSAAELDFEMLLELEGGGVTVQPIPRFPAIERDLSVVVDESVRWADIAEAVSKKAPNQLEDLRFVGIYCGKGIDAGNKSVTLSLRFRDEDGTLRHETVDEFEAEIVKSLTECVGAKLRTV